MVKLHSFSSLQRVLQVFFKMAFVGVLVSFLVGCPANVSKKMDFDETKNSQYYLSQASNAVGVEQINWQLLAIRSLIIEDNSIQAKKLLSEIPQDLNKEQQKEKNLLQGELAVKNNQDYDLKLVSLTDLNDNQKIRYYKIKIGLDGQKKDVNAQIRDYIELEAYGSSHQRNTAINDTWGFLTALNEASIRQILVYANESVLQGWVDLIYTYRNNANVYSIEASDDSETVAKKQEAQFNLIKNAVSEWKMQYSTHPAAIYLPRNIYGDKFRLPDDAHSKSVALLLPLSGSSRVFGDTIHAGYADATKFYPQDTPQNIYVYDTNSNSIANLVKQAKQQGVELIVGPLLKQDVAAIIQLSPDIPVLALNKIDESELPSNYASQICFFALSPEDEAKDAALHIYSQGKKQPLLILPNNNLGNRVANSFAQQWNLTDSALGDVYVQHFESEKTLSSQMNSGMGIELEGTRLTNHSLDKIGGEQQDQLASLLTDIMAEPNNTKQEQPKFDAIYIYASHEELTLIKSMLEMKSTKGAMGKKVIPAIYASSRSNTANTTQDFRYDMERVQFSDIPLILDQHQMVEDLPDYIKNDYSLVRLYALGVDAWQLANQFNQLEPNQIDILDGKVGKLSVGKKCEITRALTWLQYLDGNEVIVK